MTGGLSVAAIVLFYLRILEVIGSFFMFLSAIVLMLVSHSYRNDRKAQWEKEQQTLQNSTLQN